MGTGMLALPIAFSQAGLAIGLFYVVLMALLMMLSLHMLLETRVALGAPTFTSACEATLPGCTV